MSSGQPLPLGAGPAADGTAPPQVTPHVALPVVRDGRWWVTRGTGHGIVAFGQTLALLRRSAQAALELRDGGPPPGVRLQPESVDLDALAAARELYLAALRAAIDGLRAAGVSWIDIAQACEISGRDAQAFATATPIGAVQPPGLGEEPGTVVYTYVIEISDDREHWRAENGASTGTTHSARTPQDLADTLLADRLNGTGRQGGSARYIRVAVWEGGRPDHISSAAAVAEPADQDTDQDFQAGRTQQPAQHERGPESLAPGPGHPSRRSPRRK
ncbi:hypothetical protein AB0C84_42965 [Actinomadura sp. NPDC048955]|uniref:hypothetical protein n=1 Tax=Actinomadura sp. NPDC048955 TaxID=3158228 RepID=UPI003403BF95